MATALQDFLATLARGVQCTQEAGDGPFVYAADGRRFASRTARCAERLGLARWGWDPSAKRWCWTLAPKDPQP